MNIKNSITTLLLSFFLTLSFAQKNQFTTIYDIEATQVKSQGKTGTCWSFSASSFIESEIFRKQGLLIDLSEMYTVRNTYEKKAANYILRQGKAQFSQGSLAHDVLNSIRENGLVPEEVYSGGNTFDSIHNHSMVFKALDTLVHSYINNPKQVTSWIDSTNIILDTYFGKEPNTFTYNNKQFTPKSFQAEMKINPEDYITLTSYTHHPYFETFILEIPDNFSNGTMYNLPLNEYIATIDYALSKGYSIVLDIDVSEKSFSSKTGIATLPVNEITIATNKEKLTNQILKEKLVTQESRQKEFYNYNTTDDHLMHITGLLKDLQGNKFYKVKNSWGTTNKGNGGYVYISTSYIQMKSISILLHKDGISKEIKDKLKL